MLFPFLFSLSCLFWQHWNLILKYGKVISCWIFPKKLFYALGAFQCHSSSSLFSIVFACRSIRLGLASVRYVEWAIKLTDKAWMSGWFGLSISWISSTTQWIDEKFVGIIRDMLMIMNKNSMKSTSDGARCSPSFPHLEILLKDIKFTYENWEIRVWKCLKSKKSLFSNFIFKTVSDTLSLSIIFK